MGWRNGYTGHLFEEEVLGPCPVEWHGGLTLKDIVRFSFGYKANDVLGSVRHGLRVRIARALGVFVTEVKLISVLNTPLDRAGVDGVFVFRGIVVTIDFTTRPEKDEWKADVVIHPEDIESSSIQKTAQAVAEIFAARR